MHEDVIERGCDPECGLEVRGLARDSDFSLVKERENVAQHIGFVHIVRADQNGHIEIAAQVAQAIPHGMARDGIEADGWLVEKKDNGTVSIA